jgi:hypothetical protein
MGKSVRSHTVRFHNRIKKEKLEKLEMRRAEAISARAAAALAKFNADSAAADSSMPSLTPMEVETAKILIEEEQAASGNLMDGVENLSEIPTQASGSMKKKRQTTQRKSRK